MGPKPRLLYLASFPPLPTVHGAAVRMWNLLKRAAPHFEITFIAFDQPLLFGGRHESDAVAACLRDLCREVRIVPRETAAREDPAVSWMPQTARNAYSPAFGAAVRDAVARAPFDLAHVDFFELAQYVACIEGLPAVATEQDASNLSLRRSFLRSRSAVPTREGADDWHRAMRYFHAFLPRFRKVIALTEPDRRTLARLLPLTPVELISTGVDLVRFGFRGAPPPGERLVFVGHYYHYPNEEAILRFARDIWPLVSRRRPRARLDVVGSCPTPAVSALNGSRVRVTGTVADVRPYLRSAAVFIAPMRLGEGIKGKVLEAFAAGVPVVATPPVARALGARPGRDLLTADDPAAFARAIDRLLDDRALSRRLAVNARALVESKYDWEALAARWIEVIRDEATRRAPPGPLKGLGSEAAGIAGS